MNEDLIVEAARGHALRVAVEERLLQAQWDANFHRGRARAAANDVSDFDVAVISFEGWTRSAYRADAVVEALNEVLAAVDGLPESIDPITLAKEAADIAEQGPGSLTEAYGR